MKSLPATEKAQINQALDPLAAGLIWAFSVAGKLFIYQSLVLIAGHTFGCYNGRDVFRIAAFFLLLDWLILLALVPLYWPLIGIG